jgi:hypothetical protein
MREVHKVGGWSFRPARIPARECSMRSVYRAVAQVGQAGEMRLCPSGMTGLAFAVVLEKAALSLSLAGRMHMLWQTAREHPRHIVFHLEGDPKTEFLLPPDEPMLICIDEE